VIHVPSWRQLLRLVMQHPVDLAIIDVYDPFRPVSFQQLQRLRRKHADLAILVYSDFLGRESDLFALGRLQVDGVLPVTGRERGTEMSSATERALARAAAARVVRTLEDRLPAFAVDCLGWAVDHAEEQPRVDDLAEAVGVSPRALARDLRDQDLPRPNQLLVWGRLLQAARLLQEPGATVDQVAYRMGYSTGGALRRAIKRGTGLTPGELVRRGGLAAALDRFVAELTGAPLHPAAASGRRKPHWAVTGR
jgi:AraC-like DNA-binding protein